MKNIYFIRHGETFANVIKMFQGCSSNLQEANLNGTGLSQAQSIAELLKDKNDETFNCSGFI